MFLRTICIAALLAVAFGPAFSQQPQVSPRIEYAKQVHSLLLKEVRYPPDARADKLAGRVVVLFRVGSDGSIQSRQVDESSGHDVLDQAALDAVDRLKQFPPFPPDLKEYAPSLLFRVPMAFQMRASEKN